MSWNFEFTAKDKGEAKAKVAEQREVNSLWFPEGAANAVVAAIDALPDNEDADLRVKSWGHIDQPEHGKNGNAMIELRTVYRPAVAA